MSATTHDARNHLFVPGPTNIPERVRRAMDVLLEDHRNPSIPAFHKELLEDVKKVFLTEKGRVFMMSGSGTGAWEAVLTNTLSPGDKVVQAVFGQFSHLWADMCERLGLDTHKVEVEWGEGVPLDTYREILSADKNHEIKAVLATQNETATGVTSDIKGVRAVLDELNHPALLFVDGVSSVASIEFRMDEWGVDGIVSGSQKGFMLPTGMAIFAMSEKAMAMADTAQLPRCYFDIKDHAKQNDIGSFPYTPPLTLYRGLRESVNMLLEEGMENVWARHHRFAEATRKAVEAWGLEICAKEPKWHSDTVTAILAPEHVNSADVVRHAFEKYNMSMGAGLAKVAGRVFRIGHLGLLNEGMMLGGLGAAECTLLDLGVDIKAGSGVGAAVEYLRTTA